MMTKPEGSETERQHIAKTSWTCERSVSNGLLLLLLAD